MKKTFCLLFFISFFENIFCQQVIINGIDKNRLLTWSDFTGTPDKNSVHDANTYWKINYSFSSINYKGDTADIKGFAVKLELEKDRSWIKPGKETTNLLKHEQGHFDIGIICQQEFIQQVNKTIFLKPDFQKKIEELFSTIMIKYTLMGLKYDSETNHSKDQEKQDKWNNFFATKLQQ